MARKQPEDTNYFHYYNANPKNRHVGDCLLRALSKALDVSWDDVLDGLVVFAHKTKQPPGEQSNFEKYLSQMGYVKVAQPKHPDGTKLTGEEFCELLDDAGIENDVLANIGAEHITVFVDVGGGFEHQCWDIWNCTKRKIGKVYMRREDLSKWSDIHQKL